MTDIEAHDADALPDELPPVEPPSAGFILQLFLIPALIIGVIVGVVFVFGMMATSQDNWQELVQEIGSPNKHIRWRAAMGLAQILPVDEKLGERGKNLVANRKIAEGMCNLLEEQLQSASQSEEQVNTQAFLTRAVQLMRVPDLVIPTLIQAIDIDHDVEVRKNGLVAIAVVANRANEAGQPLTAELTDQLVDALQKVSQEPTKLMRQTTAFALGMLHSERATQQLKILLDDSDRSTRANAMIGLARQNDSSGFPVLVEILETATITPENDDEAFEQLAAVKNAIAAIEKLAIVFTAEERNQLTELLGPIADKHSEQRLRLDASTTLKTLDAAGNRG